MLCFDFFVFYDQDNEKGNYLLFQHKFVLYDCLQIIANFAILCEPFLPFTAQKLMKQLNLETTQWNWSDAGRQDLVPANHMLHPAEILFEKIEDSLIDY